jgi:hypothetical protein
VQLLTLEAELPLHVGKRIEAIGEVTNTKCPYVCGIDACALEAHRGNRMKFSGILS